MPSTTVKNLYIAKSLTDLESESSVESSVKGKSTNSLVLSCNKIFNAAEKSNLDMDEEKAYVQYTRFVELVIFLKKRADFQKNPEYKSLIRKANTALGKAEQLKASLSKRYSILEEADCRTKNERNDLISALHNNKSDVIIPAEPVSPKVEVPKTPEVIELSMSSSKLFNLLTASMSSIVLMDTRSSQDFNESHIKHSCCINIPQEILRPGTTALKLEKFLPEESLAGWHKRDKADYIILIDFDSKDETTQCQPLEVLKQAITKWDQKCTLKRPPLVLQGGYKDWMLKYPMYTTQALNFSYVSDSVTSPVIANVAAIEYPNLDEPDGVISANKENLNEPGMLFKKSNVPFHISDNSLPSSSSDSRNSKSAPTVDRKSKPVIDRGTKTSHGERKHFNNATISNQSSKDQIFPSITNNVAPASKNSVAKTVTENKEKELVTSLNKEETLAKENLALTKEQLAKEEEFEKLRLRKELAAEESIRLEIQKREEHLAEALKQLEIASQEKEATYLKIKEDNMKLKKQLEEKMRRESHWMKEKEILDAEKERKSMLETVERLREQRKKQELEKKKSELAKQDGIPREAVSANTGLKRNMSQQDQNNSQNSEYTMPLSRQSSSSSGHGLVRSHSSPNIAQMINQEENSIRKTTPTVDRSLKPQPSTPSYNLNEMHRARLRNLHPVHGICSVRPATGLRNLGNTCFMNSIIQCLSNTIPLADYFTSGQYVKDINRDSKYGSCGEVVEEFAIVIRSLWMGQYKSFSPRDFKNTVSKCLSVCIGNEQQDSHEFLVVLMEKLHADLNVKSTRTIPKLESSNDENAFWQHHKSYNSSKISDVFEGLLKSTLTCMSCRTTSDSFEVFSCLSLPILSNRCSLMDCIKHFLKSEKISGEAAWDCPKCKTKKEAEKRLRISRLPEILVIQLKRFSYEGLWRRKLQTNVDFDFHFDVPYEKNSEASYRKYSLYGIVNHFGTLEGGHYTAYCNNSSSQKWFKYDDHEVSEMSSSDVKTSAAYLLFYRASDIHSNL